MSLDTIVKTLLDIGIQAQVQDTRHYCKDKLRKQPYSISEITQQHGNYFGRQLILNKGGALIIEHDVDNNKYQAEFRLITSNKKEFGKAKPVSPALDSLEGKKYYSYRPQFLNYDSYDKMMHKILSNRIFVNRAK